MIADIDTVGRADPADRIDLVAGCDLELSCQTELLERINGQGLLGITLTSSYLMVPMKSITAIMGIRQ